MAEEEKRAIERLSVERGATEGTPEVLSYLRDAGFEFAVVSNSSLQRLSACLGAAALTDYFPSDRIFSAENSLPVRQPKPLPDIYLPKRGVWKLKFRLAWQLKILSVG